MQLFRKIHKLVVTCALGVLAYGCSESLNFPDVPVLVPGTPGTITIKFKNSQASRNEASDNSETLIQTLTVYLFDSTADDVPAVYSRSFTPDEHNATTVVMSLTDEMVEKLFSEDTGNQCRMYAVANVDGLPAKPTINEIKAHIVTADFYNFAVQTRFAMAGEGRVQYTPADNSAEKGKAEGDGKLYRTAAKIQLNIKLPEKIEITDEADNVTETWYPQTADNAMRVLLNNGVQTAPLVPPAGWEPAPADGDAYYSSDDAVRQSYRTFTNGLGTASYPYGTQVPFYSFPNAWEEAVEESHKTTLTLMVPWRKGDTDQYRSLYYQVPVTPGTLSEIVSNYAYIINLNVGMLGSPNPDTSVEVDDINYQVVDWASEEIDVNINDTRYLVVNPNYYVANNESQIVIPFYTSHPAEIYDINITYQRFNFYSNGNGDVVDIEIDKEQIDKSVSGTDSICNYYTVQNRTTGQMSIVIDHSLKMWTPVNTDGNEVKLTGMSGTGDYTLEKVVGSIDKYEKPVVPQDAYSPYVIKVEIRHKDNAAFKETIEIVQYPAMYIQADNNPGGSYAGYERNYVWDGFFSGHYEYTPAELENGYVYVNATYSWININDNNNQTPVPFWAWENDDNLGGVHGLTGNNTNPNMYVITISQLEQGTKYIIGDPRSKFINNSLSGTGNLQPPSDETTVGTWSNTANVVYPSTSSTKRGLRFYYPTYEYAATDKEAYTVAPKIRIASSWGVTNQISRENARRRCASYQEQGFPAGRWRLPTLGEFTYITQLSAAGKIPTLFSLNKNYLTAQGVYRVNSEGVVSAQTNATSTAVRAVYDDWYWENLDQYAMPKNQNGGYDYTLGDVPRQ